MGLFITREIRKHRPVNILFTTTTLTGWKAVKDHARSAGDFIHQFSPIDTWKVSNNFLRHWKPDLALFMEGDAWPLQLSLLKRAGVPVFLLNGRLSRRSAQRWGKIPSLGYEVFASFTAIFPRSAEDGRRFRTLSPHNIRRPADLKMFQPLPEFSPEKLQHYRNLFCSRFILLAASTHPGDEELLLKISAPLRSRFPNLLVIFVPRHPDRGPGLASRLKAPFKSRDGEPASADLFWIVDEIGCLGALYQIADRVILGNTLAPPGGGHNIYEPLGFGACLATGPHLSEWEDILSPLAPYFTIAADKDALMRWVISPPALPAWKAPPTEKMELLQEIVDCLNASPYERA